MCRGVVSVEVGGEDGIPAGAGVAVIDEDFVVDTLARSSQYER